MKKKPEFRAAEKQGSSFLPTLCFLLLAFLILYAAIRLIVSLLAKIPEQDVTATDPPALFSSSPFLAPTAEPISEVFTVISPAPTHTFPAVASPSPTPEAPRQSSVPSATAFAKAKTEFNDTNMDLLLLVRAQDGTPDCIAAIAIRGSDCTVVFLPNNTVSQEHGVLNATKTVPRTLQAVESILPVSYGRYVSVNLLGVPDCIDAIGGIPVGGEMLYGTNVAEMLKDNGSDELIRISAQQKLVDAFLTQLKSAGLLRYAALKAALSRCTGGNLTNAQYLLLYQAFRRIEVSGITYRILPVDSCIVDGIRCYQADTKLVDALVDRLYPSELSVDSAS